MTISAIKMPANDDGDDEVVFLGSRKVQPTAPTRTTTAPRAATRTTTRRAGSHWSASMPGSSTAGGYSYTSFESALLSHRLRESDSLSGALLSSASLSNTSLPRLSFPSMTTGKRKHAELGLSLIHI